MLVQMLFIFLIANLLGFIPMDGVYSVPPPRQPMVALSFDDGPSAYTDSILDILEQYNSRATFFVLGPQMMARPATAKRAFELGSEVANHTWNHLRLPHLSDAEIIREIQSASTAIESLTGYSPPMFRPPFGMSCERLVRISTELGYAIVKWTLDPVDWRYRDADIVYNSIMSQVEDGSVILLHDTRPTTAAAMKRVIPRLIEKGFQLVTVSELLYYFYGELEPGRIYGSYTVLN